MKNFRRFRQLRCIVLIVLLGWLIGVGLCDDYTDASLKPAPRAKRYRAVTTSQKVEKWKELFAQVKTIRFQLEPEGLLKKVDLKSTAAEIERALKLMGYHLSEGDESFDAKITLTVSGEGLRARYTDNQLHYTGAKISGKFVFTCNTASITKEFHGRLDPPGTRRKDSENRFTEVEAPFEGCIWHSLYGVDFEGKK